MPTRYGSISLKNGIWKDSTYPNGVEITKIVEDGVTVWDKDYVGLTYTKLEDSSYSIRAEDTSISGDIKIYAVHYFNDGLARSIENKGFYNCNNITSVGIYGGIESIGNEAFAYCDNLKYVIMPSTVTYIGTDAFLHSPADIYYYGFLDEWNNFIVGFDDYTQSILRTRTYVYAGSNAAHLDPFYEAGADTLPPPDGFKGYWYYDENGVPATATLCDYYTDDGLLNFSIVEIVEPTCTEVGYIILACNDCGKQFRKEANALDHDWTTTVVPPTCTEQGYTYHMCKNDIWHSYADNYTEALGHKYSSIVKPPTCTEQGYTEHTCDECGDKYVDSYIEALGRHDWSLPVIIKPATCLTNGKQEVTCSRCLTKEIQPIPATGHNWKAATCTTPKTCSKCGATEGSALGHTKVSYPTVQPTYTTVGYRGGSYCSVCGTVLEARRTILKTPVITDAVLSNQAYALDLWVQNNNSLPVTCYVSLYDDDMTALNDDWFTIAANASRNAYLDYSSSAVMPLECNVHFEASGYEDSYDESVILG